MWLKPVVNSGLIAAMGLKYDLTSPSGRSEAYLVIVI